jgi:hypothetical protein
VSGIVGNPSTHIFQARFLYRRGGRGVKLHFQGRIVGLDGVIVSGGKVSDLCAGKRFRAPLPAMYRASAGSPFFSAVASQAAESAAGVIIRPGGCATFVAGGS